MVSKLFAYFYKMKKKTRFRSILHHYKMKKHVFKAFASLQNEKKLNFEAFSYLKNKKHISVPTSTEATASKTLYTAEFKEAAIKTAREYKNITKAAEDLNMPRRTLRGWIEKYEPMDT